MNVQFSPRYPNRVTFDLRVLEFDAVRELLSARCVCELGRRRVAELHPSADAGSLRAAIGLVTEMMGLLAQRLEPPIHGLRDVTASLAKAARERAVLEPDELLGIKDFLETAGHMRSFFAAHAADAPGLHAMAQPLFHVPALIRSIDEKIGPDARVRDTASDELRSIRHETLAVETQIQKDLQRMVRALTDSGDLQDDFFTLRNNRYVLPVRSDHRGRVKGIIHDSSNSGETVFIEPFEILEMSNRLAELRIREREEVIRVLMRVAVHVRDELNVLTSNAGIMGEFDLVYARARFGADNRCAFPNLTEPDRPLRLAEVHHPLLYADSPGASRPLNLALDPGDQVVIITGPNAGGKTTALKTIGLTILLVQCAVPVPLSPRSHMPVFRHVLADIGDEQSILEGVSTFSAHMKRMVSVLAKADGESLVLLDELGTATDPGEGSALSVAILESLAERGAVAVATSHLGSLKAWAHAYPSARNASFRLSERDHRPTFQLTMDLPGISEALVIAEQVGLPPEIIERARALRPAGEGEATELLLALKRREQEMEDRIADLERERGILAAAQRQAEEAVARLREEKRETRRRLVEENQREMEEFRARVNTLIAHQPSRQQLAAARTELEQALSSARGEEQALRGAAAAAAAGPLTVGSRVRLERMHEDGVVEELNPKRGEARVTLRNMTVTARIEELSLLSPEEVLRDEPSPGSQVRYRRPGDMPLSIDLHGRRVDEALRMVDKFIDDALAAGMSHVRLVHGHGSGALRRAIHEMLREHPQVRAFRHGNPGEGGGSVTVADFK